MISLCRKTQEELNEKRHEAYKLSEALEDRQRELQQRTMQVNEAYPKTKNINVDDFTCSDIVYMHIHLGINNQTVVDMNIFIYYTESVLNNRLLN